MALSEAEELELLELENAESNTAQRKPSEAPVDTTLLGRLGASIKTRSAEGNAKRQEMGLSPIPEPDNSAGGMLKELFLTGSPTPGSQESAKAMMESMGKPAALIRKGASKVLEATGAPKLDNPDSYKDILEKQVGMPASLSYLMGLPADVALDPLASFIGSHGFAGAEEGVKPAMNTLKRALTLRAPEGYSAFAPVGEGMQEAGKRIYRAPFAKADERVLEYRDSAGRGPHEFTDELWNGGQPKVGGYGLTNKKIQQQVEKVAKGAWDPIEERLGRNPIAIDIAPGLTEGRMAARENAIAEHLDEFGEKAADKAYENLPPQVKKLADANAGTKQMIRDKAKQDAMAARHEVLQGDEALSEKILNHGEDKFVKKTKARLMEAINGGPNEHQAALDELKEAMPELADHVDMVGEMFRSGDKEAASKALETMISDGMVGERSVLDLHQLAKKYGTLAAGSDSFMTNAYKKGNKVNARSAEAMKRRGGLTQMVKDAVKEHEGEAGLAAYERENKVYGALARGLPKAQQATSRAATQPGMSKLDMIMTMMGGVHPEALAAEAGAKVNQWLNYNPRVATGTGMLLNDMGKSSFLDRILLKKWGENEK